MRELAQVSRALLQGARELFGGAVFNSLAM